MTPKGQHGGNRSQKSGLARVAGAKGGRQHTEQGKPHVPQKVIRAGKVTKTKSTKKPGT